MIRRHVLLALFGVALAAPALGQNVDAQIAARAGDAALKTCLDRSQAVADYRAATQAVNRARDPKTPGKFNCSGIGASWQEVAPKACCAAFERDKGRNADAAWTALQVCGWQAKTAERRPAYEAAARQCLAQTAAKPATPSAPSQQAQKPQTPAQQPSTPQQQAQRPQPAQPSVSHRAEDRPFTPPIFQAPTPSAPRQAEVPLTPPPPLAPLAPSAPQQAQVPLTPPPPIPPQAPVQQALVPTGDPVALKALVNHLQMTAVDAWKERPPLKDELKNPKVPGLLVFKDASGEIKCADKGGPAPFDYFRKPHKLRYRLIDNRDTVVRAIANFGYSLAEAEAIADAMKLDESKIPPEIRDRRYALWDGMDLYHFLYGTMLLYGTRAPAALKVAWDPLCPEPPLASSEHSSVRGTINGGGDFINYAPAPAQARPALLHYIGGPVRSPAAAPRGFSAASGAKTTVRVPGGSILVPEDSLAAIDVAPNGVTAVAALAGAIVVRESETKSAREIAPGTLAVIVPKKGVSAPVPLPGEARKNLVQMRREAGEARSIAQAPSGPRLSDATPARGVRDGRPVDPTTVFRPDAKELFVWFRLSGIAGPTGIRSVWNYVAPDGDQFIVEAQATARPENQWGDFRVEGPPGRPWPTGQYRVDIYVGNKKATSVQFRVEDSAAHPAIVATRAALGVKNGEPVGAGEVFPPDAGTLYAWFRMAGHKQPTKLRGEWHYLGGGGDRMVIASDLTIQPNESWGDFQFELPAGRPWPLGAYRVDILMDGKVAASVPFRIEQAAAKPAPQAQAAPKIVEAKPARGVKDGKPVEPTEVFARDAGPIYVWFRYEGMAPGAKLRSVWRFVEPGSEQTIVESVTSIDDRTGTGNFKIELPKGNLWPAGPYRLDVMIGDQALAAVPFRVAEAAPRPVPAPKIVEAKPARGVKDGNPVEPGDVFTPDINPINIWFRIVGHDRPVKLLSEWHYLGAGRDELLADIEMTAEPGKEGGHFQLRLQPGRLWPLGEFRVDILVEGKPAASVPFRVVSPTARPAPEAQAAPKILEAKPARGVKDGKPVDPGTVFAPDTNPIYVWYRLSGNAAPTEIAAVWHYLGGGRDEASEPEGGTHPAGREWGFVGKELPPGATWPVGEYRVDILANNVKLASVAFQVAAPAPKATISQAQVARGVKDGKPVDPGAVFAPDASPLYVWFRVADAGAPVKVSGEWHYLGGGTDRVISRTEGEIKPGMAWANFRRTLPEGKSWEPGSYRFDIHVEGALAASVPFRIEAAIPKPAAAAAPAAGAITLAGVEALLRELGADPQRNTRKDGVPYFEFALDGRKTALALYGCTPGPCAQALLHTGFRIGKKPDLQAINDWNRDQRFVRAYLDRDGDPTVESDLVVKGAETAALREWIATWRRQVPQFLAHVTK